MAPLKLDLNDLNFMDCLMRMLNTVAVSTKLKTVCSCHVTYAFQSEFTLYICLKTKELLVRNRHDI